MMIVDNVQQGSLDWLRLRLGLLTASSITRLLTPAKLGLSSQRIGLMHQMVAEWAIGEPIEEFGGTMWTERGTGLEPEARAFFEFQTGESAKEVAFVYKTDMEDERACGCSPDSIIYRDGPPIAGLEIKCPKAATHVGHLLEPEEGAHKYDYQTQFSMWVTGLPKWWFMSYFPGLPPVLREELPDEKWFAAFDKHVPPFLAEVRDAKQRLRELGAGP